MSLRHMQVVPGRFTSGAAASEEHSESSMVSGRMEALSLATTATRPLFWEKKTGRLEQQPPPRITSPEVYGVIIKTNIWPNYSLTEILLLIHH